MFGPHIYLIVEQIRRGSALGNLGEGNGTLLADGLTSILYETGIVLGAAAIVYLLAPPREDPTPGAGAAESA